MNIKNYFYHTLNYDLINKFIYSINKTIPNIKRIVLTISFKNSNLKTVVSCVLLLKIFSASKSKVLKKKKSKFFFKLKKNEITGCQIILSKSCYSVILLRLIYEILPYKTNILKVSKNNNNFVSFSFNKNFFLKELEMFYSFFREVGKVSFSIIFKSKNVNEVVFILNSIKVKNVTIL